MLVLPVELQPDESALIELPDGGLRLYEPPRVTSLAECGPGSGNLERDIEQELEDDHAR